MSKRITPEEIILFHQLYAECHNYAEVGRRTGRSASTIARYIGMKNKPTALQYTMHKMITG